MTITATERKAGPYVGNGSLAQYGFAFKAANPNHLQVVEADAAGVETTLVHVTNYTVALNPNQTTSPGGTITRKAGNLPAGYRWTILSLVPYEQPIDLPPGGALKGIQTYGVTYNRHTKTIGKVKMYKWSKNFVDGIMDLHPKATRWMLQKWNKQTLSLT